MQANKYLVNLFGFLPGTIDCKEHIWQIANALPSVITAVTAAAAIAL